MYISDLQAVAVRMSAKKTFAVCNVYLPPSQNVNISDLEHLVLQLPAPFVLTGDCNVHPPICGDLRLDSRGKILEQNKKTITICAF